MKHRVVFAIFALLVGALCFSQTYTANNLGTLPEGCASQVSPVFVENGIVSGGLNKLGQVAGISRSCGGNGYGFRAVLFTNGGAQDLGTFFPNRNSFAIAVNDLSEIAGYAAPLGSDQNSNICQTPDFAWVISKGVMTNLDKLPNMTWSHAIAINNLGQVVGMSGDNVHPSHVFLYSNGVMQDLNDVNCGPNYVPNAINNSGQVVGWSQGTAFLFLPASSGLVKDGICVDLGALPGDDHSIAYDINDLGQIVGVSTGQSTRGVPHPFLYSNGVMTSIGGSAGLGVTPSAINNHGQIVGRISIDERTEHAVIFTNDGIRDLNVPVPNDWPFGEYGFLRYAYDINDMGQIAGNSSNPYAFLLTPDIQYKAFVQQPIDSDGGSVFSSKKGVVPVKFTLTLDNVATCSLPLATISLARTAGGVVGTVDEGNYIASADSGSNFRIDLHTCQYIYNLAASSLGTGVYRVDISINGSAAGSGVFALK